METPGVGGPSSTAQSGVIHGHVTPAWHVSSGGLARRGHAASTRQTRRPHRLPSPPPSRPPVHALPQIDHTLPLDTPSRHHTSSPCDRASWCARLAPNSRRCTDDKQGNQQSSAGGGGPPGDDKNKKDKVCRSHVCVYAHHPWPPAPMRRLAVSPLV